MVLAAFFSATSMQPAGSTITFKYFETGHSHTKCDSMHTRIEKAARHLEFGRPAHYHTCFETAKTFAPRYEYKVMG